MGYHLRPGRFLPLILPFVLYTAHAHAALPSPGTYIEPETVSTPVLSPSVVALNRMQIYAAQGIANAIEAQAALHDKNIIALDADLTKVQVMLELIHSRMPGAEFLAMVNAMRAKMHFEDNQQVQPFFSHLFYALDDLGKNETTLKARQYLIKAQHALAVPNRAEALIALRKSAAVFDNPFVSPPLKAASETLQQAFTVLNTNNDSLSEGLLKSLVHHLEALHRAFSTYPLNLQSNAASIQD